MDSESKAYVRTKILKIEIGNERTGYRSGEKLN